MDQPHARYNALLERCKQLSPTPTAVAHPCDESSIIAASDAAHLIAPILVGPINRIKEAAIKARVDISSFLLVDAKFSQHSAEKAVAEVRAGRAHALMKGSLHTDELMSEVVKRDTGLRTARRISHCFVLDLTGARGTTHNYRRRGKHSANLEGKSRHRPERDRSRTRFGCRGCARGGAVGNGDDQSRRAVYARSGSPMQDGRPKTDHRRRARRPACARQRNQFGSSENQKN